MKEDQQAVVREIAFEVLKAYRDRGCTLPPAPGRARVWEMMNFMIGEEIPRRLRGVFGGGVVFKMARILLCLQGWMICPGISGVIFAC